VALPRLEPLWRVFLCEWENGLPAVMARAFYRLCRGDLCTELTVKEYGWLCLDGGCGNATKVVERTVLSTDVPVRKCRLLAEFDPASGLPELAVGVPAGLRETVSEVPGWAVTYSRDDESQIWRVLEGLPAYRPAWDPICRLYVLDGGLVHYCGVNMGIACLREKCRKEDAAYLLQNLLPLGTARLAREILEASGWDRHVLVALLFTLGGGEIGGDGGPA